MYREIKFRGFHEGYDKLLGKWVYGLLDRFGNQYYINTKNGTKPYIVAEDSIGQYSGYIDINEEEIYEGDILRFGNYPFEEVRKAKVIYDNGFYIEILEGECPVLENKRIEMKGDLEQYGLEVIGTEFEEVRNVR